MSNHERAVGRDWVVLAQGEEFAVTVENGDEAVVRFSDDEALGVRLDWTPGDSLARAKIGGDAMALKVDLRTEGFRIRYRGADLDVKVRTPRAAELARLMPAKLPPDTSRMLLCPMPGVVVKINVSEGDEIEDGQALCTVEAMKMENVLRAERKVRIAKINAKPGQSMAVDAVIMEFE
jgi:propionyl-CoA carboxylase alpha chain